jgi:hypothetical protein
VPKLYPPSALPVGADGLWPERLTLREAVVRALSPADRFELERVQAAAFMLYGTMSPSADGRIYWELCCNGWARLLPHLRKRELLCTGRNKLDRFSPRRPLPAEWFPEGPIEWGPRGILNFEKWEIQLDGLTVVDVEISWGGLEIHETFRQARLGPISLKLSPRSFDLLLMLARAAHDGRFATLGELTKELLAEHHGDKALGQAVSQLKNDLERSGVATQTVDQLISNLRGEGYRLNLPDTHISIIADG